jgi:hypothetical protein
MIRDESAKIRYGSQLYSKDTLRRRNVVPARSGDGHPDSKGEGFERGLGAASQHKRVEQMPRSSHVVVVLASNEVDVQRYASLESEGLEQVGHHLCRHCW